MKLMRASRTSHGIWFSRSIMSLSMQGPVDRTIRFVSRGDWLSNDIYSSRKQPSRNIISANSASLNAATASSA
uniref:Uncharacterized protein n=1 Tax=Arundo donax TaxID=35708 RepID=A0A0A8Z2J8_ARUDO